MTKRVWFTVAVETSRFFFLGLGLSSNSPLFLQLLPGLVLLHLPTLFCQVHFLWAAGLQARSGTTSCPTTRHQTPRWALGRVNGLSKKVAAVTGAVDCVVRRVGGGGYAGIWMEIGWYYVGATVRTGAFFWMLRVDARDVWQGGQGLWGERCNVHKKRLAVSFLLWICIFGITANAILWMEERRATERKWL